jgi:hypothetical protein
LKAERINLTNWGTGPVRTESRSLYIACACGRDSKGVNAVALPQMRRGREHLVDLERSEQIYLVIRDRIPLSAHTKKRPSGGFFVYLIFY